jgi:hypothetical protein
MVNNAERQKRGGKMTMEQKTTRIEKRIVGWLRESLDTDCPFRRVYLMGKCKLALAKLDKLNGLQKAGKGAK